MRRVLVLVMIVTLLLPDLASGADPQPYEVTLKPTGNAAMDSALHDTSQLESLREKAPVGPFALVTRARGDVGRFQQALQSFGYYKGTVSLTIDGHPLDQADLPDLLEHAPDKPPVPVVASFEPGPLFHLGQVAVEGDVPEAARQSAGPRSWRAGGGHRRAGGAAAPAGGDPRRGASAGEGRSAAGDTGAGARRDRCGVRGQRRAARGYRADPVTGLKTVNEEYVRRRLALHSGEPFNPATIEAARADLANVGVFSVVRVVPADQLDPQGTIPIMVDVSERPLHAVELGIAYSTDLGLNPTAAWHHRNLFGNAEQLNITAGMNLGGSAVPKPGYNFGIQFIKPDFLPRDQSLQIDLDAIKQSLEAYDQRALLQKIEIDRKLSEHWTVGFGLSGEQEEISQEGVDQRYNLVGLPLSAKFDNTNGLLDPTRGFRATLLLTPTQSFGRPTRPSPSRSSPVRRILT